MTALAPADLGIGHRPVAAPRTSYRSSPASRPGPSFRTAPPAASYSGVGRLDDRDRSAIANLIAQCAFTVEEVDVTRSIYGLEVALSGAGLTTVVTIG